MGNTLGSIKVHPDLPSLACPGELSAWTDPVTEDMCDNVQEFFAELVDQVKEPFLSIVNLEVCFLKDLEVTERSPDEFELRVIFDAKKLQQHLPWLNIEEDVVYSWWELVVDRPKLHMKTTEWEPGTDKVRKHTINTVMHPDRTERNFKIEIWCIGKEGTRRSGPFIAQVVEWMYLKPLLACRFKQKVKVQGSIEICDTGGLSAMSDPLDEYFTAEGFFQALVDLIKADASNFRGDVISKSDMEFETRWQQDYPLPEMFQNKETGQKSLTVDVVNNVVVDPKGLLLCVQERRLDELIMTTFYRVTRDPVRCECWQMWPSGVRRGGGKQACELRLRLLQLISEAEVKEEFTSLTGKDNFMF